ncbi:MAG: murein biosynthesis integral membrane protein MurJ [Dissulfurimicrobium sp.]|uniref:murein biosynthesis integral membrane protein MurJ n=1 Tax=Dissulfurimicrobium TaxID=1769732 RepID=UPI001EDAD897|nr:murein biosynthesis integral membrane protein MurJ [Dissulfurimicrobium hydrothermale]UKL13286.1 murein biosynthesis integral membrane protein MurJ [Dissulfurimicrobium hydrothermale]
MAEKGVSAASLVRSAGPVTIAVFLSRLLGLVREQVIAWLFGAGMATDAFVVAFRIPNLLRDLFAEGALSSAFVTVFTEYETRRSREDAARLVNNVFTCLVVVVSVIMFIGMAFSGELVRLLAPDFVLIPGKLELTTHLAVIMFPFLLLVSIAALFMGILNTRRHFFIPALSSSFFNLGSIAVGVIFAYLLPKWGIPAIFGMAIGTLAGGLAQLVIQIPLFLRENLSIRPLIDLKDPGLRRIARLIIPAIVGLSAVQINIFVNTNFASRCAEGSVAWLSYAFRLMQFPIGLFGVAFSIVTLPAVSRLAALRDIDALGHTLVSSLIMAFALTVPAAIGLWILAGPIIRLIFEHGRFTAFDTIMTAEALRYYAIGLIAYSAVKIVVPVFYALNDTRWPVIVSFTTVLLNIVTISMTIDRLAHKAIALSTSITVTLNFILLAMILYKKMGHYPVGRLFSGLGRICLAGAVMGVLLLFMESYYRPSNNPIILTFQITGYVAAGTAIYAVMLFVLRLPEFREVSAAIRRRLCAGRDSFF